MSRNSRRPTDHSISSLPNCSLHCGFESPSCQSTFFVSQVIVSSCIMTSATNYTGDLIPTPLNRNHFWPLHTPGMKAGRTLSAQSTSRSTTKSLPSTMRGLPMHLASCGSSCNRLLAKAAGPAITQFSFFLRCPALYHQLQFRSFGFLSEKRCIHPAMKLLGQCPHTPYDLDLTPFRLPASINPRLSLRQNPTDSNDPQPAEHPTGSSIPGP